MTFDPLTSPIEKGLSLLEASAGTGKTYSLVRIIARQLVEQEIPLEKILTVTFTKAATAEIKHRLHELLHEIIREIKFPESEIKNDLAKKWAKQGHQQITHVRLTLSVTLANFDSAPIYTIDGFFQRILKEFAFESGALFSSEIDTEEDQLLETALRDYWRSHVYNLTKPELQQFLKHVDFLKAKKFIRDVGLGNAHLDAPYHQEPAKILADYQKEWNAFVKLLVKHSDAIRKFVNSPPSGIKKNVTPFRKGTDKSFIAELESILSTPSISLTSLPKLSYIAASKIFTPDAFGKNKFEDLSGEPYAELCLAIDHINKVAPTHLSSAYLGGILKYVKQRSAFIKNQRNVYTYNDVTTSLATLLSDNTPARAAIVRSIRNKYSAALIDEFQDTSPEQCSVFLNLFHHEEGFFHIIGDPKQSIYRFRGADVFAYIQASKRADHTFTLNTNYRSSPRMVHATNTLFQLSKDPFLVDRQIGFTPSKWPDDDNVEQSAKDQPSLYFHQIGNGNSADIICKSIAKEIRSLLEEHWPEVSSFSKTKEILKPSDIAVLVKSAREGDKIARSLNELNIPVTTQIQTSLLKSEEAQDILVVLTALLDPSRSRLTRTALLTPILGSGKHLENDEKFLEITQNFTELSSSWEKQGVMPMMLQLLRVFETRPYLLSLNQGLRRLTNTLHLAELLDKKSRDTHMSPAGITRWLELATQGDVNDTESDTLELRIASDYDAVSILTQHSSKGLEFPITFVTPPCHQDLSRLAPSLLYHAPSSHLAQVAPIEDKDSESYPQRVKESCADRARLAYVALTRSKYLCHFYYEGEKEKKENEHAVYQMLGEPSIADLEDLHTKSMGAISYDLLDQNSNKDTLHPYRSDIAHQHEALSSRNTNSISISKNKCTTSFSSITKHSHETHQLLSPIDIDNINTKLPTQEDTGIWTNLKAGAFLGSAFHEILEEIDFTAPHNLAKVIKSKFDTYTPWKSPPLSKKIENEQLRGIQRNIEELLAHSIDSDLTLDQIPLNQRLIEPNFLIAGQDFSLEKLGEIIAKHPPQQLPEGYITQLKEMPAQVFSGFLTGFIDLIFEHKGRFHLLDWKTNRIPGNDQASLATVMAEHHYFLQYHLYGLALDQFLSLRLGASYDPAKHLGNVYYIFLRGIDPKQAGSGVFIDTFSKERILALRSAYLNSSLTPC